MRLVTRRSFLGQFCKSWMTCCSHCHTPTAITCTLLLLGYKSSSTTGPWRFTSAGLNRCTSFSAKTVYARSTRPCRSVFPDSNVRNSLQRSTINPRFPWNFYLNSLDFPWFNMHVTRARKLKKWYILSIINSNSELSLSYMSMRKEQTHGYKFLV